MPMIVYTFLESYDFNGKTVIPFTTHAGSGDCGTFSIMESKLPSANVTTEGFSILGQNARDDNAKQQTIDWLKGLGY